MGAELDAVNTLLVARQLVPVTTLGSGHPMEAAASVILDRHFKEVQGKRWWFNVEDDVQLTRETNDKVPVPSGTIRIDTDGGNADTDFIILNGFLYDLIERTNVFTEDPEPMTIIIERSWDDLATIPYAYIVALAKEEFIRALESPFLTRGAKEDILRAECNMKTAHLQHVDPGTSGNPLMAKWREGLQNIQR